MKNLIILCLSAFIALNLVACKGSTAINDVVVANDYVKNTSSYQKRGAAISLESSQVNIASSGVQYIINLNLNSKYSSGEMQVSLNTSEGLYIVKGTKELTQTLTKGNIPLSYVVTASEDGRYYIYANVNIESNGVKSFRSLTLIVQVGGAQTNARLSTSSAQKQSSKVREVTGPETIFGDVVPMKAKEEVIQ